MRRRKNKRKIKIVIVLSICLLFIMAAGYAAFQTTLSITAKGNIYSIKDKCFTTTDNGNNTVTIVDYDKTCGTEVIIPEKIKGKTVTKISSTTWDSYKVFNHKAIKTVVIPNSVTYIGDNAFWGSGISSVEFGEKLEYIGHEAFAANNIRQLSFPPTLTYIGNGGFYSNYLTSIPSLENINYAVGAFAQNNVVGEQAFIYTRLPDGTIDYTSLNSYAGRNPGNLIFPDTIKEINFYALRGLAVDTLNLPEKIETLSQNSLMQLKANTVNIPSSIRNINAYAFNESINVKTINIDRAKDSIPGAPWGATNATVNWTGTN